jgi:peptidylprolyl isomerase
VRVPEGAGRGKAMVTLSFPAWKDGNVAPATFAVPIEEPQGAQAKVEKPQKATPISASKEEIRFDPKTCVRGGAGFGFGLGGVRVMVLGREKGVCLFDLYYHLEGGTTQHRCQVPVGGPPVRVGITNGSELVTSFPLPKGIEVQRASGPGPRPAVKWRQQSVPRTAYVNYAFDAVTGTGAEATPGTQVMIRLTAYADDQFDRPLPGVEKGQAVRFTVGKGEAGPGLDAAVRGMKVGGKRRLLIRQEVAGTINDLLGGVQPQTQLVVEIELAAVQ